MSRKWGSGLLGIAVAGTVALVLPVHAPSAPADRSYALAAIQPDRAVQQEATAIAGRVDAALRRSTSLLSTVSEGDLGAFSRERLALNVGSAQWPITLFTTVPGKGSEFTTQPPGERYLSAEDVSDIQRRGPWVAERPQLGALIAAVNSRTGQVLAARIPFSYFSDAIAALPKAEGVRHFLLDAQGKPLERAAAPSGEDRDWCLQLIREGEGFLATADALFAVARVPSTGWAVVVRHPLSGVNPPLALENAFMSGPTMVATSALGGPGIPQGLVLYPLAGVALLFGLAMVGWKQRWPGMEEGPIAFGEHALRRVTGPVRDRLVKGRTAPRPASPEGLVPFADVPSQLPSAIAGDDVEFLRTEQVRNLRELWSHTEERLSGQRSWVREEVRKIQETATSSFGELSSIVNQTEQRLEDARAAWGDVQASLLARIDEARAGVLGEQDARRGMEQQVSQQERRVGDSLEAFEARLGEGLEAADARLADKLAEIDRRLTGEMASLGVKLKMELSGLTSRTDERHGALDARLAEQVGKVDQRLTGEKASLGAEIEALKAEFAAGLTAQENHTAERLGTLDERLEAMRKALRDQLAAALAAEQTQREGDNEALVSKLADLDGRLGSEVSALKNRFALELEAAQSLLAERDAALGERLDERIEGLEAQIARDLAGTDARMQEDFARLEAFIIGARAALDSLEARESADSLDARRALDAQTERLAGLEGTLAQAEAEIGGDLRAQAQAIRDVEQLIQSTAERFAGEITAASVHAGRLEEALQGFEDRVGAYRSELDERLVALAAGLRDDLTGGEARTRETLAEQQFAFERLKDDLDIAVAQALPRLRTEIEAVRGEVAQRVDGFVLDLTARLETLDTRLMEAAEQRVASGLDLLETTLVELRAELAAAQEGHQTDLETLMTELAAIADEAIPALRRDVAPVHVLDGRTDALEARLEAFEPRMAAFTEQVQAMQAEAAALAVRHETSDKRHAAIEARLGSLEDGLRPVGERLDSLEDGLEPLGNRLDSMEEGLKPLGDRLGSLEEGLKQVDERWDSAQGRLDSLIKEADAGLRGLGEELKREQGAIDKRLQETEGRFLGTIEDVAARTGAVEALANQRFEQAQRAIEGVEAKIELSLRGQEDSQRLSGELGGIKGRLEGLALAHGRQQEALNAALSQLTKLQQDVGAERQDPALVGKVDDLTGLVQQLAEQSRLLAQALDANTVAATRTETWLQEELGSLQSTQGQALTALEQENAALKASLEAMRETQEALSHRMHMVVQVLSKLSK